MIYLAELVNLHCASPLPFGEQKNDFVTSAVNCTRGALESARCTGTM